MLVRLACSHLTWLPLVSVLAVTRFIDAASRYYELSSISIRQLGDKAISEEDLLSKSRLSFSYSDSATLCWSWLVDHTGNCRTAQCVMLTLPTVDRRILPGKGAEFA